MAATAGHDAAGLFVYGTLRFPDVLRVLIGRVPDMTPAAARGWRAAVLPGRDYPGLVPAPDGHAAGLLLTDLTAGEQRVLDAFEGDQYDLRLLPLDDGRHAWAYVWTAEADVSPRDWDPQHFADRRLAVYIARCGVWRDDHTAG